MRLFRFPDKFCADTRPYWVLFVGFVVSIALLIYTLYTREPERYRGIWRLFSAKSGSSSSAPDIQMVAYAPPAGDPGAATAALTFPSWNGTGRASYPVAEFLGMTLNDVNKRGRLGQAAGAPTRGVLVTAIQQKSLSYWSGLRKGDLIVSLNRAPTPTVLDFQQVAGALDASQGILMDVYRSGKLYYFTIDMQNRAG